jgi:hypothetical protein
LLCRDSTSTLITLNKNGIGSILTLPEEMIPKAKYSCLKILPNVPENLDYYFNSTNAILIKTAPLLDISADCQS